MCTENLLVGICGIFLLHLYSYFLSESCYLWIINPLSNKKYFPYSVASFIIYPDPIGALFVLQANHTSHISISVSVINPLGQSQY